MKAFTLIILLLTVVQMDQTWAQDSRNDSNEKQIKDDSRRAVGMTGEEINKMIASNNWEGAELVLKKGFNACSELGDPDLCVAGMNFNGGYLYQQMLINKVQGAEQNRRRAINYYNKVLEIYPDNQSAMSNLVKVEELEGFNESTVQMMKELAEKYPARRLEYWTRIGNLYTAEEDFVSACMYYKRAYSEDKYSEKACAGMVDLYTLHDFACDQAGEIDKFAYACSEIGLPNFSEELVRKKIINSFNEEDYENALESIILWAFILGENGWLNAQQVIRLQKKLFSKREVNPSTEKIHTALKELHEVLQLKRTRDLSFVNFWSGDSPSTFINDDWDKIHPSTALLRILYSKGKSAQIKKDIETAEWYWQEALDIAFSEDKPFYTLVASDLASLYHANRGKLDKVQDKMDNLIKELFKEKGESYSNGDNEMIRRYHKTLGGIYYDRKQWDGRGAGNALFQLRRATSKEYGYTIEPQLKRMLGDTYMAIGSNSRGVNTYEEVVTEYLSIDQIKKAQEVYEMVNSRYKKDISSSSQKTWNQLGILIGFRAESMGKDYALADADINIFSYLVDIYILETEAKKSLSLDFVELQIFKGLSDIAAQLPDDRLADQQMIYSSALEKISDKSELSSPADFYRIKSIKTSFESSVEGSSQLQVAHMNKRTNLNWSTTKSGYKVYKITSADRQIEVPIQLYELNGLIKSNTNTNTNRSIQTAEYKYDNGKFEKVIKG